MTHPMLGGLTAQLQLQFVIHCHVDQALRDEPNRSNSAEEGRKEGRKPITNALPAG